MCAFENKREKIYTSICKKQEVFFSVAFGAGAVSLVVQMLRLGGTFRTARKVGPCDMDYNW